MCAVAPQPPVTPHLISQDLAACLARPSLTGGSLPSLQGEHVQN